VITDELEDELRSAFARAAARIEVPEQARQRLLQRKYHPRTAGRRLAVRLTAVAGVVAVGAAVTVTALVSASHQPGGRPAVQLTAWTVVKQVDGDVSVTIRQLRDPAGLQRTLRADGIPASVTFADRQNPSCQPYPAGLALLNTVFPPFPGGPPPGHTVIVIRPSALPSTAGVLLDAVFGQSAGGVREAGVEPGLVHASPQCTGS
jgi:hypothetical protein